MATLKNRGKTYRRVPQMLDFLAKKKKNYKNSHVARGLLTYYFWRNRTQRGRGGRNGNNVDEDEGGRGTTFRDIVTYPAVVVALYI